MVELLNDSSEDVIANAVAEDVQNAVHQDLLRSYI